MQVLFFGTPGKAPPPLPYKNLVFLSVFRSNQKNRSDEMNFEDVHQFTTKIFYLNSKLKLNFHSWNCVCLSPPPPVENNSKWLYIFLHDFRRWYFKIKFSHEAYCRTFVSSWVAIGISWWVEVRSTSAKRDINYILIEEIPRNEHSWNKVNYMLSAGVLRNKDYKDSRTI